MFPNIAIDDYRLFVFDIDGTIVPHKQRIDPYTVSIFKRLRGAAFPFTLATGKNIAALRPLAEELGVDLPIIHSNGSILEELNGDVVLKKKVPMELLEPIIAASEMLNLNLAIFVNEEIYVKRETEHLSILLEYGSPNLNPVGDWGRIADQMDNVHKCMVIHRSDNERLLAMEQAIRAAVGGRVEYCHTLVEMLEFMPKGVSKVTGIEVITDQMGISFDAVMAFGDGNNDATMLQKAGLGVSMENGSALAKDSANLIVPSDTDLGPALFLDHLLRLSGR